MDELERRLRSALLDERRALPMGPDAVHQVHAGVRRRRWRRNVAAAGSATVAVALVATLTAWGLGRHQAAPEPVAPAPSVTPLGFDVPWVDRAAPPDNWSPTASPTPPPTHVAPACRASQLAVAFLDGNGATGAMLMFWRLRNAGPSPCQLSGWPVQVVASEPGQPDVRATRGGHAILTDQPGGDLAPGRSASLELETDRDCPARYATPGTAYSSKPAYHSATVVLPSGDSLPLPPADRPLDITCGLKTGQFALDLPQLPEPVDPRSALTATLQMPATVHAGETLEYVVALSNPTDKAIEISGTDCPGYIEATDAAKVLLGLNCDTVQAIGPGATVRYEMRLPIPSTAQPGRMTVHWVMSRGVASAAGTVTVVG